MPVLTSDTTNGFPYTVEVNLDGSPTATNFLTTGQSDPFPNQKRSSELTALVPQWRPVRVRAERQSGHGKEADWRPRVVRFERYAATHQRQRQSLNIWRSTGKNDFVTYSVVA